MDNINFIVAELVEKYNTNDPFEIANELGICTIICPLGKIKGHSTIIDNSKVFFINSNLSQVHKNIVCSAILGHIILYSDLTTLHFNLEFSNNIDKFIKELLI